MAKLVLPRVHVMVLCDEIEASQTEEDVFDLKGVRTSIAAPSFAHVHPQLCVYVQMTGHEGQASGRAVINRTETNEEVASTTEDVIEFRGPLDFIHLPWRLLDCTFPEPGLYYIQVFFDGKLIGERSLVLHQIGTADGNGRQTF